MENSSPRVYLSLFYGSFCYGIVLFAAAACTGECVGSKLGWRFEKNSVSLHSSAVPNGGVANIVALITGFTGDTSAGGKSDSVGTVVFAFEVTCPASVCQFSFTDQSSDYGSQPPSVWKWNGQSRAAKVTHVVKSRNFHEFRWSFRVGDTSRWHGRDVTLVRIFSLDINDTLDGGGTRCRDCSSLGLASQSKSDSSDSSDDDVPVWDAPACVGCPKGNYLDVSDSGNHKCLPCQSGTALTGLRRIGPESCVPCGEGTTSGDKALSCHTDCLFTDTSGEKYDFTALSGYVLG